MSRGPRSLIPGPRLCGNDRLCCSTGRVAAQTGTNLVQNRAKPDLLLSVRSRSPRRPRGSDHGALVDRPAGEAGYVRLKRRHQVSSACRGRALWSGTIQPDWLSAQWSLSSSRAIPMRGQNAPPGLSAQRRQSVVGLSRRIRRPRLEAHSCRCVHRRSCRRRRAAAAAAVALKDGRYICKWQLPARIPPRRHRLLQELPTGFSSQGNVCVGRIVPWGSSRRQYLRQEQTGLPNRPTRAGGTAARTARTGATH